MSNSKQEENANAFHYAYSCDISANLSIKIGSLEGQLPKPNYEQANISSYELPIYYFRTELLVRLLKLVPNFIRIKRERKK